MFVNLEFVRAFPHSVDRLECATGINYRLLLFFFFQAEDGIRDIGVTGVQTCALPISWLMLATKSVRTASSRTRSLTSSITTSAPPPWSGIACTSITLSGGPNSSTDAQIGRASCRERV